MDDIYAALIVLGNRSTVIAALTFLFEFFVLFFSVYWIYYKQMWSLIMAVSSAVLTAILYIYLTDVNKSIHKVIKDAERRNR